MANKANNLLDWLGLSEAPNFLKARVLGNVFGVLLALVYFALFVWLLFGIFWAVWSILEQLAQAFTTEDRADLRWSLLTLTAVTASLGALVALPLTVLKTIYTRRQTQVAEQGHITDQINKAVENLGATRTVKDDQGNESHTPNLGVRIGGILALERISKASDADHIQIMEILCAYIRENARQQVAQEAELDTSAQPFLVSIPLRDDLATAFDVIDRRKETQRQIETAEGFRLNFRYADFRGLKLFKRDLTKADLAGAQMQGASLNYAKMQGAKLNEARMRKTVLSGAQMQEAYLQKAQMQGAYLQKAKMQGAVLELTQIQGADLRHAQLQGAVFDVAQFDGRTNFANANFKGASARCVNFAVSHIQQAQVNQMFGDGSVTLPDGMGRPSHWPTEDLDRDEFRDAWRAWQNEIGFDRRKNPLKHPHT